MKYLNPLYSNLFLLFRNNFRHGWVFIIMKTLIILCALCYQLCASDAGSGNIQLKETKFMDTKKSDVDTVTLGAGCFWCVEAVFQRVNGVISVTSGYSGGTVENPTYNQISTGTTGHAEVLQISYNPQVISFTDLLEIFFSTHDPTTLNRQGADAGTQYRSAIFYHDESQKQIAESAITELEKEKVFEKPIVTEVTRFTKFYTAEDYHQNYYNENSNQPYCRMVIRPKLDKLEKVFKERLKK